MVLANDLVGVSQANQQKQRDQAEYGHARNGGFSLVRGFVITGSAIEFHNADLSMAHQGLPGNVVDR
ncbi:hypothetical protein D3C85_1425160 [compost metagenome]